MSWQIAFYQDSQGNIPVQDFIRQQPAKVKAKILRYLDLLQDFDLSLGQPYVKKLAGSDVWELRVQHSSNYYRILYFAASGHSFVLLHAFLKKSARTPKNEIKLAENRIKDYRLR